MASLGFALANCWGRLSQWEKEEHQSGKKSSSQDSTKQTCVFFRFIAQKKFVNPREKQGGGSTPSTSSDKS